MTQVSVCIRTHDRPDGLRQAIQPRRAPDDDEQDAGMSFVETLRAVHEASPPGTRRLKGGRRVMHPELD